MEKTFTLLSKKGIRGAPLEGGEELLMMNKL